MKKFSILAAAALCLFATTSINASAQVLTIEERQEVGKRIEGYLASDFASCVKNVKVTGKKVIVKGKTTARKGFVLAEITPWQDITELGTFPYSVKIRGKNFRVKVDRMAPGREGIDYDRVFSKWAVVKVAEDGSQSVDSFARYADYVAPKASPKPLVLKNKKGFGAGGSDLYLKEIEDLDIGSITMNVSMMSVIGAEGDDYSYGGKSYALGTGVADMDRILTSVGKTGTVVSAIVLCDKNSMYTDPEINGGYYSMPNLTSAEAFNVYAAAIEYMASRYCGEEHGRISHWIMHNEVDMGSEWTNMGSQPMLRYLDRYVKSMRICYNIVRQYDQNASILGSYTHNWTTSDGDYSPKEMLEKTVEYSSAEGDFRWGVAYHPYPQDLAKPEFWKDDTRSTWSENSLYVTFKNLEVIDKWIRQKDNFYKGKEKRVLFLSEQGTNSPSYSEEDLALQAAGGAWAWKKASALEGIDAIQWHGWADNMYEFGLRIGLHTFAEGDVEAMTPKPVWYVWQAAGTDRESEVLDPYMKILGIDSWDQIMHEVTE